MKILLLGSGGREHAIARSLLHDPAVSEVIFAPGNPALAELGESLDIDMLDGDAVAEAALSREVDLVIVGPEAPLVAGVADAVRAQGIPVFGPSGEAAQLEGSKAFAKHIMASAEVPTAMAHVCTTMDQVDAALDSFGAPYVVKDDGLAAGKGVVVTEDREAARAHARACVAKDGGAVVIEEYLDGPEVSLFCVCDGARVVPLQPAQDFKRAYDGDEGPNTGGMGAYSPLPWLPEETTNDVVTRVAQPVVAEMARRGTPFVGLLYCGLAMTSRGMRVVEFNVRFGDPETQVVLPRLRTPLGQLLLAAAQGQLPQAPLDWREDAAVGVVLAAAGYPGPVTTGDPIEGIAAAEAVPDAHVIQAGTALAEGSPDTLVSGGGRVLAVVGIGESLSDARTTAYTAIEKIHLEGSHYRRDIAAKAAAL